MAILCRVLFLLLIVGAEMHAQSPFDPWSFWGGPFGFLALLLLAPVVTVVLILTSCLSLWLVFRISRLLINALVINAEPFV
jgi:hypothetical protein